MSFYHHHLLSPCFYIPQWVENYISLWYPTENETIEIFECTECDCCSTCEGKCDICTTPKCNNKLNVHAEEYIPYEKMEEDFIKSNPWILE